MGSCYCIVRNNEANEGNKIEDTVNDDRTFRINYEDKQLIMESHDQNLQDIAPSGKPTRKISSSKINLVRIEKNVKDFIRRKSSVVNNYPRIDTSSKLLMVATTGFETKNTFSHKEMSNRPEEDHELLEILRQHSLFKHLEEEKLKIILEEFSQVELGSSQFLAVEGYIEENFYVVKSGVIKLITENQETIKFLNKGDTLGEIALIHKSPKYKSSAFTLTDVSLWCLSGKAYKEINLCLSRYTIAKVLEVIDVSFYFKNLNSMHKMNLANAVHVIELFEGEVIPEIPNKIFLIDTGSVEYKGKELNRGEVFGDVKLLLNTNSSISLLSKTKVKLHTVCFEINEENLIQALGRNYKETITFEIFKMAVNSNKFFEELFTESNLDEFFKFFSAILYLNGRIVIPKESTHNQKCVILLQGTLATKHKKELQFRPGQMCGEELLNLTTDLKSEVISKGDTVTLEASWESITNVLNSLNMNSKEIKVTKRLNKLRKISFLSFFNDNELIHISSFLRKQKFQKGEHIYIQGQEGDNFYLIIQGRVVIYQKNTVIREMELGNCFGELSLLTEEKRESSVIALTNVACYLIPKEQFIQLLANKRVNDYLRRKICLEDTAIQLNDLYYLKVLGRGKFGTVLLVHNGRSSYAIKVVNKPQVNLEDFSTSENKILPFLDHPFIIKFVKTLSTEKFFLFLFERIYGISLDNFLMDLMDNQRERKRNKFQEVKFYSASLISAVDYLNRRSILHRDIKPQNIMIDEEGYFCLVDFGLSKCVKDFTYTVTGTPHYMAPEILRGNGYSFSIDWWSIGVCVFYIHYGYLPFGDGVKDVMTIYNEILDKDIDLLYGASEINSFLLYILNKDPNFRLCSLNNAKCVTMFKDFPWEDLLEKKLKPPYIPDNLEESSTSLKNFSQPLRVTLESDTMKFGSSFNCNKNDSQSNYWKEF